MPNTITASGPISGKALSRAVEGGIAMSDGKPVSTDFTQLDDSALIAIRREVREQLEREPANMADLVRTHHLLTTEVVRRTVALRRQSG